MKRFFLILLVIVSQFHLKGALFSRAMVAAQQIIRSKRHYGLSRMPLFLVEEECMPIIITDCDGTVAGDPDYPAPTRALQKMFERRGFTKITREEIEAPMGLSKLDHIKALLEQSGEAQIHFEIYHDDQQRKDEVAHELFQDYCKIQPDIIRKYSPLVPGVLDAFKTLRAMGVRYIGATTGYPKSCAQAFQETVERQGLKFDSLLCPDDVGGHGRPVSTQASGGYQMLQKHMKNANISDPCLLLKIGDTAADIAEGRALQQVCGNPAWSVGLIGARKLENLLKAVVLNTFKEAHFVIPSIYDLPFAAQIIADFNFLGIKQQDKEVIACFFSNPEFFSNARDKVESYRSGNCEI